MELVPFIHRICDDGAEAARADYSRPDQADKLEGALNGFAEAREAASTVALLALLTIANQEATDAHLRQDERYWFYACRRAEIEWVCNVVSAALMNQGLPVIITPTTRGAMKAAEILGVTA